MRSIPLLLLSVVFAASAHADCPDCPLVAGGGPAASDCAVEFGGITSTSVTCADGDPACDTDGQVDGACTFALQVCINVAPGCAGPLSKAVTVKPAKDDATRALQAALSALGTSGSGCTPAGFRVPLKVGLPGIKPGVEKLTFTAVSGGQRDRDKLKLTCVRGATPSFQTVEDIMCLPLSDTGRCDGKCSRPGCHTGPSSSASGGQSLDPAVAYADSVNATSISTLAHGLKRVAPGSLKKSYMARKLLGVGLKGGDTTMPLGCGAAGFPCVTDQEKYTILAWIQGGAPAQ